jgi:hypothetical protein
VANNVPSQNRISSLSSRLSRFKEDSMQDKPSEKPPSVFLRALRGSSNNASSFDDLMDKYHEKEDKPRPVSTARAAKHATQLSGLTHHPNVSISSSATFANSTQSRESSIFRFGRSMASSINPVHLWKKVTSRENKDEDRAESDIDLVERQIRAEQAYAELKSAGQLGNLESHVPSPEKRVYTLGYTVPGSSTAEVLDNETDTDESRKQSRNAVNLGSRPQRISATPGKGSASTRFHIRTPSLNDLKRIASDANLHRRTSLAALNTEKENADMASHAGKGLRTSKSKKDLTKAVKLSRRVSDLEAKLESARRELKETVSVTPPVPMIPGARPVSRSTLFRRFQPMPSLPSESLLVKSDHQQNETILVAFNKSSTDNSLKTREQQLDRHSRQAVLPHSMQEVVPLHQPSSTGACSDEVLPIATKSSINSSRSRIADEDLILQSPDSSFQKQHQIKSNVSCRQITPCVSPVSAVTVPPPNFSLPTAFTATVGVATHLMSPITEPCSGLETVQEEMCSNTSYSTCRVPLKSPPLKATAMSTPTALPRRSHHQPSRSMSPVKGPERHENTLIDTQRYRDRDESPRNVLKKKKSGGIRTPPRRGAAETVWIQPNGWDVPPLPCQTTTMSDGSAMKKSRNSREMRQGDRFDWPDDCF